MFEIKSDMYVQSNCCCHIVVVKLNISLWHELVRKSPLKLYSGAVIKDVP